MIGPGGRTILIPQAVDESGQPATSVSFLWEAESDLVGEITALGSFHAANASGVYHDALRVTAVQELEGEVAELTKTVDVVITGELTEASVTPSIAAVSSGRTVHLSGSGKDQNGVDLPGLIVLWTVTDEEVGTIDAFGNFTAGDRPGLYEDVIRAEFKQTIPVD